MRLTRRIFLTGVPALAAPGSGGFAALFDGKTLNGWRSSRPELKAWVEEGSLCLLSRKAAWLVHDGVFGDFVLETDLRVPDGGNSGVQFRSQFEAPRVVGYQAEVDTSPRRWAGGLYDQGRRAWLGPLEDKPEAQAAYKNNEWNRIKVECVADHIRIWMNGVSTIDYIDPVDLEGHVALQHHGDFQGHPAETYRFKNLRLKSLGRHQWVPAQRAGVEWQPRNAEKWERQEGRIVWHTSGEAKIGLRKRPGGSNEFTLRFSGKPLQGDARVELQDGSNILWLALTPDERFGRLYRSGFEALAEQPPATGKRPVFTPELWNSVVLSNRAGRLVVHVNGIRTSDWKRASSTALAELMFKSSGSTHVELRDLELLRKI